MFSKFKSNNNNTTNDYDCEHKSVSIYTTYSQRNDFKTSNSTNLKCRLFFPVIRQLTKYFRPIPWIFPSMLFSLLPPTSISDRRVWGNKWSFKSHHFPNVIAKQRGKKMIEWETGYIQLLEEQIRFFFFRRWPSLN